MFLLADFSILVLPNVNSAIVKIRYCNIRLVKVTSIEPPEFIPRPWPPKIRFVSTPGN